MMLHYKNCGLDNIWLANGFTVRQTAYGKVTSYTDVEGLYMAIALELCQGKHAISSAGFRFLRKQLNLTQSALGEKLGYADQTIAKWEKGTLNIPIVVAQYMRLLCLSELNPNISLNDTFQVVEKEGDGRIVFENIGGSWRVQGERRDDQKKKLEIYQGYIVDTNIATAMRKVQDKYEKSRWVKPRRSAISGKNKLVGFVDISSGGKIAMRGSAAQKRIIKHGNEKNYH